LHHRSGALRPATHSAKRPRIFRAKESAAIAIAVSLIGLALAALAAALIAAKSGGFVRVVAQTLAVILASVTGALIGFFTPLIPLADGVRGTALAAGILGTLGTIGGMSAAEALMGRLDRKP
jgi:fatty acid desaturase